MTRLTRAVAIVLGWASVGWASAPPPITSLHAVHLLSNAEASQALPAAFEATVTYFRSYEKTLFVQDGDSAIYVQATTDLKLLPGDRVLIKGTTHDSFRPFVLSSDITLLRHGAIPRPVPATFDELIRAQRDCMLVTVHGVIRSADLVLSSDVAATNLQLHTDGGSIDAVVDSSDVGALQGLLDAEVEVTGAASGRFDGKMQQTGVLLHASSLSDIRILKRAAASPWSLPVTPMDEILMSYHVKNLTRRVRVQGTVTYYQPGSAVVLQNGARSLWIMTQSRSPLKLGDVADATGFPDVHDGFLTLSRGEIQDSHLEAPVVPQTASWRQLTMSRNVYDLVSIEGQVEMQVREGSQDEYVLLSDGQLFSAIYRHPPPTSTNAAPLPPMKQIPLGSKVRVTGICILESSNPFDAQVPFDILLRSLDDVTIVAKPSWINMRNLISTVGVLLLLVVAVGMWAWTMKSKVRRQTAALAVRIEAEAELERRMAQLEKRRSQILEDINGSRPLAEILEQITEMVSVRLGGSASWCDIAGGARLGKYPGEAEGRKAFCEVIPARDGKQLGVLFAALDPQRQHAGDESEALSLGARLAALAIETRRLYADLRHRSEFDLLTDIHNRFSLDRNLDALIEDAQGHMGVFGLIYIDLDEFKQVNDVFGHHVGDLYLQEVAIRMKRQLRSGDMLARLGGDEFAALLPQVGCRAHAEEIAHRLERSFDEPFAAEGYILHGSASVGVAFYPEDGSTRDSLLSAADAAMYVAKHTRHGSDEASEIQRKPGDLA
jgi:diguanylate cyclase (GGDEF)-like protein